VSRHPERTSSGLVLALLLALVPRADAQVVIRGPYLQDGTASGLVIRWRTDQATGSRVHYGPDAGSLTTLAGDDVLTTEHEVTIGGLPPETAYVYGVGTSTQVLAGGTAEFTFHTNPPPGAVRSVRFWVIGDSGTANFQAAGVRNGFVAYAGNRTEDAWLMLGDNAYPYGTDAEYQAAVFDMYPALLRRSILWPTRGNHDQLYNGSNNDYYEIFTLPSAGEGGGVPSGTEAYYSFDYANVHFLCLDSQGSSRTPGSPMLTWLASDLAATPRDWVIAYWHHPPYTKGTHDSDDPTDSGGRMRDMRENVLPILENGGVDLVLTGHSHDYERSFLLDGHYGTSETLTPGMILDGGDGRTTGNGPYRKPTAAPAPHEGAVYVVAGSSGQHGGGPLDHPAMFLSLNRLGSLVLDVSGLRLDAAFLDTTGTPLDSFTVLKGSPGDAGTGTAPSPTLTLGSPRPNPLSRSALLPYLVPRPGRVVLTVVDVQGRPVATLLDEERPAGSGAVRWDGRDGGGRRVAAGTYFAVLRFEGRIRAAKVVVSP